MPLIEKSSVESLTIGKGAKKEELVIISMTDEWSGISPSSVGNDYEHDTGASSDNPFGLVLVSLSAVVAGSATSTGTVNNVKCVFGATTDVIDPASHISLLDNVNSGVIDSVLMSKQLSNSMADAQGSYQESRNNKIIVMPKIHVGYVLSSSVSSVNLYMKAVFKKVKLTKNEYLEKLVRNI